MLIVAGAVIAVVLFGACFLVFGAALVWRAVTTLVHDARLLHQARRCRSWPSVTGRVVRSVVTRHVYRRGMTSYTVRLSYEYGVAGHRFHASRIGFASAWAMGGKSLAAASAERERFAAGAAVVVHHDPVRPEVAVLDRTRPSLLPAMLLALLLLPFGAGFAWFGGDVIVGAVTEPPRFAPGELPPLREQFGVVLLALAVLAGPAAAVCRRRARQDHELVQRLSAVDQVPVARARPGATVGVGGIVEPGPAGPMQAVTGAAAVYQRVRIFDRGSLRHEEVGHREFYVRDDTGRVLVATRGGLDLVRLVSLPNEAAVLQWVDDALASSPEPVPEIPFVQMAHLAPGDRVVVVGRVGRDGVMRAPSQDRFGLVFARGSWAQVFAHAGRWRDRARRYGRLCLLAAAAGAILVWA